MTTRSVDEWLNEYSASHLNPFNKAMHWVCVPSIVFSLFMALKCVPVGTPLFNLATLALALSLGYYLRLSWRLAIGLALVMLPMYGLILAIEQAAGAYTIAVATGIFVVAWIGQFIGHHVEGARPSFLKDVQFRMIGPMWLMAFAYRKWQIPLRAGTA